MGGRQAVRPRPLEPVSKVRILPAQPVSPAKIAPAGLCDMDLVDLSGRRSQRDGAAVFWSVRGDWGYELTDLHGRGSEKTMGRTAELKIFAGNSNPPLAAEISQYLKVPLGKAMVDTFSDGESKVEIKENVRGADVFVLQSTSAPGNDNLMELLLMLDAFKRASAQRITAVMPYYGYARQDRKVVPRVPISAKLVADLITRAGASRMLTMDLHSGQIQGFFDIPVDNVYATPVLLGISAQASSNHTEVTIVSPDAGGVERARAIATRLDASLAIIDKRRVGPNVVAEMNIIGEVEDRDCDISRRYGRYRRDIDHGRRSAQKRRREENYRLLLPSRCCPARRSSASRNARSSN